MLDCGAVPIDAHGMDMRMSTDDFYERRTVSTADFENAPARPKARSELARHEVGKLGARGTGNALRDFDRVVPCQSDGQLKRSAHEQRAVGVGKQRRLLR